MRLSRALRRRVWRTAAYCTHPALAASPTRDNTVTTSTPPDPSNAPGNPRKMDDLDAPGPINTPLIRLRALWTAWSVVVRVNSGALGRTAFKPFVKAAGRLGCLP
jgi:hypothetical protein